VLAARARAQLGALDLLLVPTVLEHYLIGEIGDTEDSVDGPTWPLNAKNGRFTNFVNLLDMCGISIPQDMLRVDYAAAPAAGLTRADRLKASGGPMQVVLPFGVTLLAGPWRDEWLWGIAERLEAAAGLKCGPAGHGVTPAVVG
jgi:allophanate hydrolase